jgi:hypothetical protein
MKAPRDVYKFSNVAICCFKGPSIAMKTPILILNIQNHYHKMIMLKALKWPSKQLCATTHMGPFYACNNQITGLYWPIKNMVDCYMRLLGGPA